MSKPSRPYGGLTSAQRRASRRERLAAAAFEFFGTHGFHQTTIPMLCTGSGVTARHFYEEFGSREALLRAILDDIAERTFEIVREALRATDIPVHERVLRSNRAYYGYLTADPRRARIYALESLGISVELEQHRREIRERSVRQLTRAAQWNGAGTPVDLNPRLVSIGLSSAAIAILAEWVLAERKPAVEEMAQTLTLIWMRTLRLP